MLKKTPMSTLYIPTIWHIISINEIHLTIHLPLVPIWAKTRTSLTIKTLAKITDQLAYQKATTNALLHTGVKAETLNTSECFLDKKVVNLTVSEPRFMPQFFMNWQPLVSSSTVKLLEATIDTQSCFSDHFDSGIALGVDCMPRENSNVLVKKLQDKLLLYIIIIVDWQCTIIVHCQSTISTDLCLPCCVIFTSGIPSRLSFYHDFGRHTNTYIQIFMTPKSSF